jgi:AAA family ATP:ADP antiporter
MRSKSDAAPAEAPARGGLLRRAVDVRRDEVGALLLSFAYFFALLCGYYVLRPIRDEMGISRGVDKLPVLFTGTFVAMSVASPLFGWLASRWPRQKLIPWTYHFFALDIVLFYALWKAGVGKGWVPFAFYIWAAVYNLFVTSVFWSFMTDVFTSEQGKRLFGFISAGGSLGALAGPLVTSWLVKPLGGATLLLVSALLLEVSAGCVFALARWARRRAARSGPATDREHAVGGTVWSGIRPVVASPYLLASAAYILLLTVANTFLYFDQAHLVTAATTDRDARTALFARIDLIVNVCTLVLQVLVTGHVLKRLGVAVGLSVAPVINGLGDAVLALSPTLGVFAPFQGVRRAAQYAILRPSREMLFTVVSREERYKSKNFIDTVVFRAGDMASGWIYAPLAGVAGRGVAGTAWVSVAVSVVWLALGVYLGREQRRRAGEAPQVAA